MKVTINLTKQEAIEALLQFYKHTGATEIVISDDEVSTDDGWISNIGNDNFRHPDSISSDAFIEVKRREGSTDTGVAFYWQSAWAETNGHSTDIVAYRILPCLKA